MKKNLVLTGMMGVGKTTIGKILAKKLKLKFVDTDKIIQIKEKSTIKKIFEDKGESYFRNIEKKTTLEELKKKNLVMALGGGAFIDGEIRRLILERSTSIWLRADLDTLVKRTEGRTHRPLLNDGNTRNTLEQLIVERYPIYAEADIVVDTGSNSVTVTCNRVIKALTAHLNDKASMATP